MNEKFGGFENKKELTNENIDEIGKKIIEEQKNAENRIVKEIVYKDNPEIARGEVPTEGEITEVIRSIIAGRKFEDVRELKDEKGSYLREVRIEIEKGVVAEYQFMRRGKYPEGKSSSSNITVTFYESGFPVSGEVLARYENGKWNLTS